MPRTSDSSTPPPPAGPRRSPRVLKIVLGGFIALVALVALALLVITRPPVATRIVNSLLARASSLPRAHVSVHDVRGSWLADLELHGFRMVRGDTVLVRADTLHIRYRLLELLVGRIHIRQLDLAGVEVSGSVAEPGAPKPGRPPMSIADLLRGRFYGGPAIVVDRVALRRGSYGGDMAPADSGWRLAGVELAAHHVKLGGGFALTLDSLGARLRSPGSAASWANLTLAGRLAEGRADVRTLRLLSARSDISGIGVLAADAGDSLREMRIALHGQRLALGDARGFVRGFDVEGDVTMDIDVHGPRLDRLSGSVNVRAVEVRTRGLNFGPSRLSAALEDGRADVTVTTTHEGAGLEARGWIRPLDADPAYDITLRTDCLPRRLRGVAGWDEFVRRAPTRVELRVRGHGYAGAVLDLTGNAHGVAGNLTLDARVDASHGPAWEVRRLAFTGLDMARLAGDSTESACTGVLTARGRGFTLDSLRGTAELSLAASHYGPWRLRSASVRARAEGPAVALNCRLDGEAGTLSALTANARLDGRRPFRVRGMRFDHLDLSRLTESRELASDLNGNLEVDGHLGPPLAVTGNVLLEPSRLRGRAITNGRADLALERGALMLDAQLDTDAGRVAVSAGAHPFALPPEYALHEARFTDLDLGAWGVAPVATRLNGRLTASAHDSTGSRGRLPADWQVALHLDRSRIGALECEGGNAEVRLARGRAGTRASLRTNRGAATFTGNATWDSTGAGLHGLAGRGGFIVPFSVLAGLAGRDTLPAVGAVYGDVTFGGDASGGLSLAGILAGRGSIGAARIDTLFAGLRYDGSALQLDTLEVRSNVGQARAAGRVALSDSAGVAPTDLRLVATLTDLSPLTALVGADSLDAGSGELEARLAGPAGTRALSVTTSLRTLAWNDLRLLRARVNARGTLDRSWRVADAHGTAEITRLHSPAGAVQEASTTLNYAARTLRFDIDAALDDRHHVRLDGVTTADSLGRTLTLETADVDANTAHWRLAGPARLRWGRDRLEITDLEARSDSGVVRASGVLDRRGDQDFRCEVRGAGLDIISAWLGRTDMTGRLDGEFSLIGPAAMPRGAGQVRMAAFVSGEPVGDLGANLAWDGRRLDVHGTFTSPQQDSLVVAGRLPLELSLAARDSGMTRATVRAFAGDVDLRIMADRFPLHALLPWLPPRVASSLGGTLDADARLAGSGETLTASGQIALADGNITLLVLGTAFRGIRLNCALSGNRLLVREAHATSGKGDLKASGELRFVSFRDTELDLAVTADRFSFMDMRDVRAIASGDLRIAGHAGEPRVTGRASIGGSYYLITEADLAASQAGQAVPLSRVDVRMLEETFGYLEGPPLNPPLALYDAADLDLQIHLERDNWLRQRSAPRFSVEVIGDVHLRKLPHAEPELFGRVAPVPGHGYIEQFGRTFDVAGGEILLNGDMKDHTVDLRAEYETRSSSGSGESDVVVHLGVQGPVDGLRLTLTSEPPLSETDILTFIATGRDPTAVQTSGGSNSGSASLAADIGMSQLTGGLQSAAQEKAGLDVLQVRFDAQQGATLVAGSYVGQRVYLGVRQPLQYRDTGITDATNPYRTRFEVEYEKYQWLVLNLQGEVDLLRGFLRARYAY